jgi:hypothetical protein
LRAAVDGSVRFANFWFLSHKWDRIGTGLLTCPVDKFTG